MLKFFEEDGGFCRVYYKNGVKLYCWQDDGSWGRHDWKFYVCSRDGEPSHEVSPQETPPCPAETSTGRELNAHLAAQVQP